MPTATIYRQPVESAMHQQMKVAYKEYLFHFEQLMKSPSRTYAERARKALIRLKASAHKRGIEILDLYAAKKNIGKKRINLERTRKYKTLRLYVNKHATQE